jgi:hypothetical protein
MSAPKEIQLNSWQNKARETIFNDLQKKFGATEKESFSIYGTFIPGPPGTGKTTLINHIIPEIKKEFPAICLDITATTGAAATRLNNAITLASWLQIGCQAMKLDKFDEIWSVIESKKEKPQRIQNCDILIMDEVSMMSQKSWESLNRICQGVRQNPCEFGGIYVIALGDPFQLPPVPHDSGGGLGRIQREFVASCLERQYPGYKYVVANEMMRAEDLSFRKSLLKLVSPNAQLRIEGMKDFWKSCYQGQMNIDDVLDYQQETGALILTPVKKEEYSCEAYEIRSKKRAEDNEESLVFEIRDVEQKHTKENKSLIEKIGGKKALDLEEKAIKERESWPPTPSVRTKQSYMIRANFITPEYISVCNGDTGEIISYESQSGSVKFLLYRENKIVTIKRREFSSEWVEDIAFEGLPIIPSPASTVHKAQGATMSGIILDPRRMWVETYLPHKLYTAFSRVRKMKDIRIAAFILDHMLDTPDIQAKLEFIWKIPYMKEYLTPDNLS